MLMEHVVIAIMYHLEVANGAEHVLNNNINLYSHVNTWARGIT